MECVAFRVDASEDNNQTLLGLPVVSDPHRFVGDGAVRYCIAVGDPVSRCRIAKKLALEGALFESIVDPQAWIGATCSIGKGSIIFGYSSVTADSMVGRHVLINPGCTVAHDNRIDDFCSLSPGVDLAGHVECDEGCFLGTGAAVRPRIRLGRYAYVGAGSVVVRDIEPGIVVAGNPARPLKTGTRLATDAF